MSEKNTADKINDYNENNGNDENKDDNSYVTNKNQGSDKVVRRKDSHVQFSKSVTEIDGKHGNGSNSVKNKNSVPGNKMLVPHETGTDKFHSKKGKEFLSERVKRKEDLNFLQSGLGCSYILEPSSGILPPWGVQIITVRAYNDMPGTYDDEITCKIMGKNGIIVETYVLPLKMSVRGCPFVIVETSLGMSVSHDTENNDKTDDNNNNENIKNDEIDGGKSRGRGRPLLLMGHSSINSEPLVRDFHVKNAGSKVGFISWESTAAYPDENTNR